VGDTLTEGQKLGKGESLTSNNGAYTLTLQDDGNLVLAAARGEAVWATNTNGQNVERAEVQTEACVLIFAEPGQARLAHRHQGKKNVKLVLQDDRNLVLYAADGPAWDSKTETDAPPPEAPELKTETEEVAPAAVETPAPAPPPPPARAPHRGVR
jgi:hypothetical protein